MRHFNFVAEILYNAVSQERQWLHR